jgi:hypothetical protein
MKHAALLLSDKETAYLSRLAEPWVAVELSVQAVRIQISGGTVVTLASQSVDVARFFECFRVGIDLGNGAAFGEPPIGFGSGAQCMRILQTDEWLAAEPRPAGDWVGDYVGSHGTGRPGSAPAAATHSCTVDCGVLFVAPTGQRLLIRCAEMPCWLAITQDDGEIECQLENYGLRDL